MLSLCYIGEMNEGEYPAGCEGGEKLTGINGPWRLAIGLYAIIAATLGSLLLGVLVRRERLIRSYIEDRLMTRSSISKYLRKRYGPGDREPRNGR